mgnify:CR=1 FL=1
MLFRSEGHLIYIVSPSKTNVDEATQKGYVYIPIYIEPHGTNPISEFKLYRQYLSIYKLINPDMVISMTIKPDVYSGLACRRLGVPYITVVNGIGDAIYNRGILSRK